MTKQLCLACSVLEPMSADRAEILHANIAVVCDIRLASSSPVCNGEHKLPSSHCDHCKIKSTYLQEQSSS